MGETYRELFQRGNDPGITNANESNNNNLQPYIEDQIVIQQDDAPLHFAVADRGRWIRRRGP